MPAIGITGGVATGKSSFVRALREHRPAEVFDADACVHELLAGDAVLQSAITNRFGPTVCKPDHSLDRVALRELVFRDEASRKELEQLIHPRVRWVWQPKAQAARQRGELAFFDIPLLYETGIEGEFDRVVVIAASPEVQRRRLTENRSLASELIESILAAQLDLPAKVARADHVVWNDGSTAALDAQARLFAAYLREIYG